MAVHGAGEHLAEGNGKVDIPNSRVLNIPTNSQLGHLKVVNDSSGINATGVVTDG